MQNISPNGLLRVEQEIKEKVKKCKYWFDNKWYQVIGRIDKRTQKLSTFFDKLKHNRKELNIEIIGIVRIAVWRYVEWN